MALTDHGNLFGAVSFVKQAEKHGKPIIGCEGYLVTDHKNDERPGRENHKSPPRSLAKNFQGTKICARWFQMLMSMGFITDPERIWRLWQSMRMD